MTFIFTDVYFGVFGCSYEVKKANIDNTQNPEIEKNKTSLIKWISTVGEYQQWTEFQGILNTFFRQKHIWILQNKCFVFFPLHEIPGPHNFHWRILL